MRLQTEIKMIKTECLSQLNEHIIRSHKSNVLVRVVHLLEQRRELMLRHDDADMSQSKF